MASGSERYKKIRKPLPPTGSIIESRRKLERKERDKEFREDINNYK